ncbi:oxygen-independent coproporphyrinogen III oxidase [Sphingomonas alba]|uniref:oxygen-independent coproporphyrinogen III oxidase n=1 Tax=Sphingomonas alba TaxID=2908208 RepID=UPI0024C1115D|nr:oxygen-independent coproporphyrinogen III oxidase [Sphingomonas alba]
MTATHYGVTETLDPGLLARYGNANLPRYTSYPTAPHFTPAVSESQYRNWLAEMPPSSGSLYLHVPFCKAMCWYCGCHTTVASRDGPISRYLDHLTAEIDLVAGQLSGDLTVRHVHFGGGTPTLMPPARMRLLMAQLRTRFCIVEDAEIAIEIDPRTLRHEMAKMLGECGFNRASLGVQSFDHDVQKAINRVQSFEETAKAVRSLREAGLRAINFDLIYGLPGQTLNSCLETVRLALKLCPERLAVFGYAHVPSFKPHQRKIDERTLPDSELRFAQSRAIADALLQAGYVEIGLDHYALPDDPLSRAAASGRLHRNFQGYTTDAADVLLGFGASAIGRLPQGYVQNESRSPSYQKAVGAGRLPIARGYGFHDDDRLRGAIIERLMCDYRVDIASICSSFASEPAGLLAGPALAEIASAGLIEQDGWKVSVLPHARPLVRSIAAVFDAHLHRGGTHSRAV